MSEFETEVEEKLKTPSKFNVLLLNDDFTPFEFVVAVMMGIFDYEQPAAESFAATVHENGKGVAASYSFEIAKEKQLEASHAATTMGHPLRILLEEA